MIGLPISVGLTSISIPRTFLARSQAHFLMRSFSALRASALSVPASTSASDCCARFEISTVGTPM